MKNFDHPYSAATVKEFWARWHISLSTWFRDYLYIPLGGNRCKRWRHLMNIFIVFLVSGLWHGAAWTFVVWGALHGVALCIHKGWMAWSKHDKHYQGTILGNVAGTLVTYAFVCLCWVFFRADSFTTAGKVIRGIMLWQDGIMYISTWTVFAVLLIGAATLVPVLKALKAKTSPDAFYPVMSLNTVQGLTIFFIALGLTLILAYTGSSPFIYFQF